MLNVFQRTQGMTSGTSHDQAHAWRYCQNSFQNYPTATKSVQNSHEINETYLLQTNPSDAKVVYKLRLQTLILFQNWQQGTKY